MTEKLFLLHIPKTAGTSLGTALSEWFCSAGRFDASFASEIKHSIVADNDFVWGHMAFSEWRELPGADRFRVAAAIREPFARLASHLKFTDRYNDPHFAEDFARLSDDVKDVVLEIRDVDLSRPKEIEGFLGNVSSWGRSAYDNLQVRFLASQAPMGDVTPWHTDSSIRNLRAFEFPLVVERLDEDLVGLAARFGKPHRPVPRLNTGGYGRSIAWRDPDVRAVLSPYVSEDMRLYGSALKRHDA